MISQISRKEVKFYFHLLCLFTCLSKILVCYVFQFRVSSVDFPAPYQDWTATDPLDLFQAPIRKVEANPKVQHLFVASSFQR